MQEGKKNSLLIVDDEPELREILGFLFTRKGFEIQQASNGRAAFDLSRRSPVDAILSDVRMPFGDGLELLDNVKASSPDVAVVLMTGFADLRVEDAYDRGADALLSKPFDLEHLLDVVAASLRAKEERWSTGPQAPAEAGFGIERRFPDLEQAMLENALKIGRGGLFVALSDSFPAVGEKVSFSIQLENGFPAGLAGHGTVKWVRMQHSGALSPGCGIQFEHLGDSCRAQMLEYIDRRKMTAFIPKG